MAVEHGSGITEGVEEDMCGFSDGGFVLQAFIPLGSICEEASPIVWFVIHAQLAFCITLTKGLHHYRWQILTVYKRPLPTNSIPTPGCADYYSPQVHSLAPLPNNPIVTLSEPKMTRTYDKISMTHATLPVIFRRV